MSLHRSLLTRLLLLSLLLAPTTGWGAWAFVEELPSGTNTASTNQFVWTPGVSIASGNHAIFVAMRGLNADTVSSITSSATGETCQADHQGPSLNTTYTFVVCSCYFPNGMSNTDTITITWTGGAAFNYFAAHGYEYSGLETSAWEDSTSAGATAFRTQAQGLTSGNSGSTTQADDLVFGYLVVNDSTVTITAGSGYTARGSGYTFGSPNYVAIGQDRNGANSTAYDSTGSWSGVADQNELSMVVLYKQASGGGGAAAPRGLLLGVYP